jgi:hypothetical protein
MSDIVTYQQPQERPLSLAETKAQINTIQHLLREVFQENVHYGVVPGCKKPSLWKPGAEKILATFGIACDPIAEDLSTPDEVRYRVLVNGRSRSGVHLGGCYGECSSNEEKYKWRSAVCQAEWDEMNEHGRARKKYMRDGSSIQQVRTNPADVANTILKMAIKRAEVGMCLNTTAASDVFTQDIEDMESMPDGDGPARPAKTTIQRPQAKKPAGTSKSDDRPLTSLEDVVSAKEGESFHVQVAVRGEPRVQQVGEAKKDISRFRIAQTISDGSELVLDGVSCWGKHDWLVDGAKVDGTLLVKAPYNGRPQFDMANMKAVEGK